MAIPKTVMNQYLMCNSCITELTVKESLDSATRSWPNQFWYMYECSECGRNNHVAIVENEVQEGYLDGVLEPHFITKSHLKLEKFKAKKHKGGIQVKSLNLSWLIPS